jgi:hypothetical protein
MRGGAMVFWGHVTEYGSHGLLTAQGKQRRERRRQGGQFELHRKWAAGRALLTYGVHFRDSVEVVSTPNYPLVS